MQTLLDGSTRLDLAIERVRYYYKKLIKSGPAYVAFSGGKDSVALAGVMDLAGVPYEKHYACTTVDPPEVVRFMRRHHPDVTFQAPEVTMWAGIREHGYPTRIARWCCRKLKECRGPRYVFSGVRWAESPRRRARHGVLTPWDRGDRVLVNPLIDWSDTDVWAFIRGHTLPYCELYDEGWRRVGCVLCPWSAAVERDIARWPGIAARWRRGFQMLWDVAPDHRCASVRKLRTQWSSCEALWQAWLDRSGPLHGDLVDDSCALFPGSEGTDADPEGGTTGASVRAAGLEDQPARWTELLRR